MRKIVFVILVVICSENISGFLFGFGKFNFNLTRELFAPLRQEAAARSHDYYGYNQFGVSRGEGDSWAWFSIKLKVYVPI